MSREVLFDRDRGGVFLYTVITVKLLFFVVVVVLSRCLFFIEKYSTSFSNNLP